MSVSVLDAGSGEVRTIRLHGSLGRKFGRVHRMAVGCAAEAVRALSSQLPGFEAHLVQSKDRGEGFAVFYGRSNLREQDLCNPCGKEDIRFVPMLIGAKNGIVQIIVGVVLVIVGAWLSLGTAGIGSAIGGPMMNMGWALIIGGVIQMLAPMPKGRGAQDRPDNTPSYAFNGPLNTQAQGHSVPVLYGELIVGSAVVSAGIEAVDAFVPAHDVSGGGGLGSGGGGGGGFTRWSGTGSI